MSNANEGRNYNYIFIHFADRTPIYQVGFQKLIALLNQSIIT